MIYQIIVLKIFSWLSRIYGIKQALSDSNLAYLSNLIVFYVSFQNLSSSPNDPKLVAGFRGWFPTSCIHSDFHAFAGTISIKISSPHSPPHREFLLILQDIQFLWIPDLPPSLPFPPLPLPLTCIASSEYLSCYFKLIYLHGCLPNKAINLEKWILLHQAHH